MGFFTAAIGLPCVCGTGSSLAETIFFDDFEDGDSQDAMPVTWAGGSMVEAGDLVLSGTNFRSLFTPDVSIGNVSIRTRLRLVDGRVIGVGGRGGPPTSAVEGINGYYASMNPSGQRISVGPIETNGAPLPATGVAAVDVDATQEDAMLQFDIIDDTYSLWVWRAGENMPAEPLASATHDALKKEEGDIWVFTHNPQGGPVKSLFRYVHVADTHLTDVLGDYNGDSQLDASDLDLQAAGILANNIAFDLDGDGDADFDDRLTWVRDLTGTWVGDADLDGVFDSGDLIAIFTAGEYEDGIAQNSTWSTGDWNGDQEFDSGDLIAAFTDGGYDAGSRGAVSAVPEPSCAILLGIGMIGLCRSRKRQ